MYILIHYLSIYTVFHIGFFVGGGGGGGGLRMEGRTNCCTLEFKLIKNCHKATKLTTSITKEHAPNRKSMFVSDSCMREV